MVSSYELLNELCDEKRFAKRPSGGLLEVRNGVKDGLFTAFGDEENWALAHRILMPAFGPMAIRNMYDGKAKDKTLWRRRIVMSLTRNARNA